MQEPMRPVTSMNVVGKDGIGQVENEVAWEFVLVAWIQVKNMIPATVQLEANTQLVAHILH